MKKRREGKAEQDFKKGEQVEVELTEDGFQGSWYIANILSLPTNKNKKKKKNYYLVQYRDLEDERENPVRECVHFSRIRPSPPKGTPCPFRVNDEVDAFHSDGWWKGKISKVLEDSWYSVYFESYDQEMNYAQADLRLRLEWVSGKWINKASQNKEAAVVEQKGKSSRYQTSGVEQNEESVRTPSSSESPAFTMGIATQPTPSARRDNSPESIPISWRSMCRGLDNKCTPKAKDLRSDPTHGAALSPLKNVAEVEALEATLSVKMCARGTPMGKSMEAEEHFVSPFTSTIGERRKLQRRRARNSVSSEQFLCSSFELSKSDNHVEGTKDQIGKAVRSKREKSKGSCKKPKTRMAFRRDRDEKKAENLHGTLDAGQENDVPRIELRRKRGEKLASGNLKCSETMLIQSKCAEDDKAVNDALEIVEKVCTEMLSTPEWYQAPPVGIDNSYPSSNGCSSDANNHPAVVQTDCSQLLCSNVEEHEAVYLIHKKPTPPVVEDEEGDQLKAIMQGDTSAQGFKRLKPSYEVQSSFRLETELEDNGPLPRENGCLPFTKRSPLWETVASMEAFKLIPQRPHFHPLLKHIEELREGEALGYMWSVANLMESTRKACLEDARSVLENKLKALSELERHGFTVQPIRFRVEQMLKIKDSSVRVYDKLKTTEMELLHQKHQYEETEESITMLNKQLQELLMEKAATALEVAELQREANVMRAPHPGPE